MSKPLFLVVALSMFLAACASAPPQGPTHRWVAQTPVPKSLYVRDNAACEARSGFDGSGSARSASFQDYRDCMSAAGYQLVSL